MALLGVLAVILATPVILLVLALARPPSVPPALLVRAARTRTCFVARVAACSQGLQSWRVQSIALMPCASSSSACRAAAPPPGCAACSDPKPLLVASSKHAHKPAPDPPRALNTHAWPQPQALPSMGELYLQLLRAAVRKGKVPKSLTGHKEVRVSCGGPRCLPANTPPAPPAPGAAAPTPARARALRAGARRQADQARRGAVRRVPAPRRLQGAPQGRAHHVAHHRQLQAQVAPVHHMRAGLPAPLIVLPNTAFDWRLTCCSARLAQCWSMQAVLNACVPLPRPSAACSR